MNCVQVMVENLRDINDIYDVSTTELGRGGFGAFHKHAKVFYTRKSWVAPPSSDRGSPPNFDSEVPAPTGSCASPDVHL